MLQLKKEQELVLNDNETGEEEKAKLIMKTCARQKIAVVHMTTEKEPRSQAVEAKTVLWVFGAQMQPLQTTMKEPRTATMQTTVSAVVQAVKAKGALEHP
jgi:hypothetical protein